MADSKDGELLLVRFASNLVDANAQFALISTDVIPDLTEVRFYEETVAHATADHFGQFPTQFPSFVGAVGRAISDPTVVEKSRKPGSFVFVDHTTTNETGHAFRVPVKVVEGTSGLVKTYFFGDTEYEPVVLYRKAGHDAG